MPVKNRKCRVPVLDAETLVAATLLSSLLLIYVKPWEFCHVVISRALGPPGLPEQGVPQELSKQNSVLGTGK